MIWSYHPAVTKETRASGIYMHNIMHYLKSSKEILCGQLSDQYTIQILQLDSLVILRPHRESPFFSTATATENDVTT